MRNVFLLLSLGLMLSLAAGCQQVQNARAAEVSTVAIGFQVGQRAPDFDLLAVGEGKNVHLISLSGKPVIINFFCGCNFCTIVGKEWVKNKDKMGDVPMVAIGVNHWSYGPRAVRDYRARTGWTWPMLADLQSETSTAYHALTCPRVFVVDGHGIIRYASGEGASDEKRIIADALAAVRAH